MSSESERDIGWLREDPLAELNALKLERLSRGGGLVDLSMINPDLPPPRYLLDKLVEATFKPQNHRYAVSRGIRKLREAFAVKYGTVFGVKLDPEEEVCVTLGTKDGLVSALRCLGRPGDAVAVAQPTYPAHLSAIQLAGGRPVFYELGNDGAELVSNIERVLESHRPNVLLLNLPNNPTGRVAHRSELESICRSAAAWGAVVINDFVYGDMVHRGEAAPSVLSISSDGPKVEIYSLSKAYSVPGWRVGALVGPQAIVHQVARLKSHSDYGVFLPLQMAAAAGLGVSENLVAPLTRQYEHRARVLVDGLRRLGWRVELPAAGASVWAELPVDVAGSFEYVRQLLEEAGVFALPGKIFGAQWDRYVRFALVQGEERLREALQRMERVR
jgi:alanine-synthesizing transaminase